MPISFAIVNTYALGVVNAERLLYGAEDIRMAQAQARLGDHLRLRGEYDEAEEHLYVFSNSELERICF